MIDQVYGVVHRTEKHLVVLDLEKIHLAIQVPDETVCSLGTAIHLYSYMHWTQDNGPQIFGFISIIERTVFLLIISCSGIGTKIALSLLHELGVGMFVQSVHEHNIVALSQVHGIGTKKAEQLLLHLKHKIAKLIASGAVGNDTACLTHWHELTQALEALNYSKYEISSALQQIKSEKDQHISFDQQLRKCLTYLAKLS